MNCPFCDIIENQKEKFIREGKNTIVILSDPKLMDGHMLVIPKRHVEKISELNIEERNELFDQVVKLQEEILEKIATGCDITQHFRPFINQNSLKVDHLHVHIRPREFEDDLYKKVQIHEREVFSKLDGGYLEKYKKLFS